jgi:hypothetical protein
MSIIIDEKTRVVVQGITGGEGTFHTQRMQEYGTTVVAGVTPGKGGTTHLNVPVYNSVADAVEKEGADASAIFVPAFFAADAIMEAAGAGIKCIVCITEGIPTFDMIKAKLFLKGKNCCLVGPNTPGIISPGKCKIGIMPGHIHTPGTIGIISRSGTLTYEAVDQVTKSPIHRSSETLQRRQGYRGSHPDRGDRRNRRGRSCRIRQERISKASCKLYRRPDSSSRKKDGPCGCYHLRRKGHSQRKDESLRRCWSPCSAEPC